MKKLSIPLVVGLLFVLGCATLRVQAPKEPIKVDISMRLDVYQHVQNDIDAIEKIVSGQDSAIEKKSPDDQSLLDIFTGTAYAESIGGAAEEAALRRKARYASLVSLEQAGVIGENSSGMVVVRSDSDPSAAGIVSEENSDRMIIYNEIAAKNGTSVSDVQKLYAERLQRDAPAGTPVETASGSWQIK